MTNYFNTDDSFSIKKIKIKGIEKFQSCNNPDKIDKTKLLQNFSVQDDESVVLAFDDFEGYEIPNLFAENLGSDNAKNSNAGLKTKLSNWTIEEIKGYEIPNLFAEGLDSDNATEEIVEEELETTEITETETTEINNANNSNADTVNILKTKLPIWAIDEIEKELSGFQEGSDEYNENFINAAYDLITQNESLANFSLEEMGFSDEQIQEAKMKALERLNEINKNQEANVLYDDIISSSEVQANSPADVVNNEQIQTQETQNNATKTNASGGVRSGKSVSNPAISQKNVSNMSISDLENELSTAKSNVTKEYQEYNNELEALNSELAANISTEQAAVENSKNEIMLAGNEHITQKNNLSEYETNLTSAQNELSTHKTNLSTYNSNLSSAQSEVGSIGSSISSLEAKLNEKDENGNPKNDNGSIRSEIKELRSQKYKLENETIPKLEQDIANSEGKINELESETIPQLEQNIADTEEIISELENETIPKLEQDLEEHNNKVAEYQDEISTLATSNPQLQEKMDSYNKAIQYQNQVEQTLAVRKADQAKAAAVNMPASGEGSKDYRQNDSIDWTNMPMSYELDGQTYHCVGFAGNDTDGDGEIDFKPDSWEEMQRYLVNAGLTNTGQHGTLQCHNYSNVVVDIVLGVANTDLVDALIQETEDKNYGDSDMAGDMGRSKEYNTRDCQLCKAVDRDAENAIIKNELQNGRPCLVSVPHKGGTHWVVAVGMSDDGDILIWDSYDGGMEKLGRSSNDDNTSLGRNMASANGVMVFVEGTRHRYDHYGYLNYWNDCVGNTAEETAKIYEKKCIYSYY